MNLRQIVLDTETTGLDPKTGHRIIEIGCVEIVNRRLTGEHYHVYINPERDIDREAQAVHGIGLQMLKDKPIFSDIAQAFFDFINGAQLVIHNAAFDMGFINHEYKLLNSGYYPIEKHCSVLDTLSLARELHPGQKNNLDVLCKRYHVDNTHRQYHGALLDAQLLAHVFLLMTGGQAHLFDDKNSQEDRGQNAVKSPILAKQRTYNLTEIQLSSEMDDAHEQYLQQMQQQNGGQCLWKKISQV